MQFSLNANSLGAITSHKNPWKVASIHNFMIRDLPCFILSVPEADNTFIAWTTRPQNFISICKNYFSFNSKTNRSLKLKWNCIQISIQKVCIESVAHFGSYQQWKNDYLLIRTKVNIRRHTTRIFLLVNKNWIFLMFFF